MRSIILVLASVSVLLAAGCPQATPANSRNPFLTATEALGASLSGDAGDAASGGSSTVDSVAFRQNMTLTIANNHPEFELNVQFAAWVNASSIRDADQQDALIRDGYVQLNEQVNIGTAFSLPPGTFVYNGPGTAGATFVRLQETGSTDDALNPTAATTRSFDLITPDAVLLFLEPPESCDSVAFRYTLDGVEPDVPYITAGTISGATAGGPRKTLAQVQRYECSPLRPGFYLSSSGTTADNEFRDGDDIRVDFSPVADAAGDFAFVAIGADVASALPALDLGGEDDADDEGDANDDPDAP